MSHRHIVKHAQAGSRQAHMNTEKFNPYRHKDENQRLHQSILDTMTSLCCKRCCDIIQWKVDFGKYQPLDRPKRCNGCSEKIVAIAYHHLCQECAKTMIRCAKCQRPPGVGGEGEAQRSGSDEDSGENEEEKTAAATTAKNVHETLLKYAFVNEVDSDDEFKPMCGLDIRRLKQYKARVKAMQEKEDRERLRERERRTVLRKMKKEGRSVDDEDMVDSDEEM